MEAADLTQFSLSTLQTHFCNAHLPQGNHRQNLPFQPFPFPIPPSFPWTYFSPARGMGWIQPTVAETSWIGKKFLISLHGHLSPAAPSPISQDKKPFLESYGVENLIFEEQLA